MDRRSKSASLAVLFLAAAAAALAQAPTSGRIEGHVRDAGTEEPLPGAVVSLIGPQRTEVQTADEKGYYVFPTAPVGTYDLSVTLEGFQPFTYTQIQMDPGARRTFDFRLTRSKLQETVVVKAQPTVVDVRETAVKETVDARYVNRIPLTSRRFQEILSLFPGVARSEGTTLAQFTVQGGRIRENGWRLDGATINDFVTGTFGANVPQNSIERFELVLNGFQAEYGENYAGIANIITKSGTNDLQFFVSDYYRSSDLFHSNLDGLRDVGADTPYRPENQDWFEFTVGGPFVRDKSFYFFAFQYWKEDVGNPFQPGLREGDRYQGLFKWDYIFNDKNRMTLTVNSDPAKFKKTLLQRERLPEANRDQSQGGYIISLKDDHNYTDRVLLTSQFTLHHQYLASRPSDRNAGPYVYDLDPSQGTTISGTYFNDQDRTTNRFRLSEKVSVAMGKDRQHFVKAGADLDYLDWNGVNRSAPLYYDLRGYGPLADVDGDGTDDYIAYRYDFGTETDNESEKKYAAFVQDTWSATPKWTLDYGLRFDYQSIVDDLDISPRFGFAYDLMGDGKQKIYGNVGRFYDDLISDLATWNNTPSFDTYLLGFSDASANRVPSITDPFFVGEVLVATQTYSTAGKVGTPYKDQWMIGYAHALPWELKGEVNYTQWNGRNQVLTFYNPETGDNILSTGGRAEYRAWNFSLRKQQSEHVEFMLNYTNSVTRGEDFETFGFLDVTDPALATPQSRFARQRSDRTHLVNASALFDIPGDWELTTVYHYASGRAFSYTDRSGIIGVRNDHRISPSHQFDLSVSKRLKWGDDKDVKLVGQVLNVFNSFNVIEVNGNTTQSTFLEPTQVDLGRLVEFGFELRF